MTTYMLYTDGSCYPNPGGRSGYCAIVIKDGSVMDKVIGSEENSTNNRAELLAIINGLERIPQGESVEVISDSQYCVNGASKWINGWACKNWKNGEIKNLELWQRIKTLRDARRCTFTWVRGHNGDTYNELCDQEANKAAGLDPHFIFPKPRVRKRLKRPVVAAVRVSGGQLCLAF